MNQEFGNFKNERSITDNYIGFLRKGILKDTENYYESFEKSLQYLLGDDIFKKSEVGKLAYFVRNFSYNENINLDPIYNILYAIENKKNMEY